ncbi:MAG: type I-E CRISPR-associated protein Cas5/CasD [Desulfatirhabdiaceae bacterium]
MPEFLILQLTGPMQAWGTHTYEDFRPSNLFPTRSGLLGLIGACLGIERNDLPALGRLAEHIYFTVKIHKNGIKLSDYHTVIEARRANRKPREGETVQTRREYLFGASFYIAVGQRPGSTISLDEIAKAIQRPIYTPTLGRRSCPISAPLFYKKQEAATARDALNTVFGEKGIVYDEVKPSEDKQALMMRDVPIHGRNRMFGTRMVYIHSGKNGGDDASQPG